MLKRSQKGAKTAPNAIDSAGCMKLVAQDTSVRSAAVAGHILSAIAHNKPHLLTPDLFRHLLATNQDSPPGLRAELEWTGFKWKFGGYTFRSDNQLYANATVAATLPLAGVGAVAAETLIISKTAVLGARAAHAVMVAGSGIAVAVC